MDKLHFIKLLRKYRAGVAEPAEKKLLESYYNLFEDMPDIGEALTGQEKQALKEEIKANIWKAVAEGERKRPALSPRIKIIRMAAAAVLLAVLAGGVALFIRSGEKQAGGAIQVAWQKENRVILLPDGSRVILSAGSRLNYPSSFDGRDKREVFLYGQAFFEVEQNVSRPFIVHTENLETVVLGTSFNVKAIPGEADIVVTVRDGKVRVSREDAVLGVITPRQQIIYNKNAVSSVLTTVTDDSYLSWKDQDLLLDNLTVAEAARLLEEKYGVAITIVDPAIRAQRFTATFPQNESLERALESICVFNGVTYKYDREAAAVVIGNKE